MSLRSNLLLAALLAAGSTTAALAQVEEPPTPAQDPADVGPPVDEATAPATTTNISDKKIEQFADAYTAVQTIQQKAASELQTAKDPQAADKVKSEAESDMIAAVERTGLKVDEFNQIIESMTADANLRQRVAAKLEERRPRS
jgi:hypothetical protein